MAEERCPNCGAEVPREAGQHAVTPSAGVVECPSCGASVSLAKPGGRGAAEAGEAGRDVPTVSESSAGEGGGKQYFSGEESVEGVMKEVRGKEGE